MKLASTATLVDVAFAVCTALDRAGTVGVLGPTRMHYDQALAAVAVVSKKLSRALSDGGDGDDLGDLERSSTGG